MGRSCWLALICGSGLLLGNVIGCSDDATEAEPSIADEKPEATASPDESPETTDAGGANEKTFEGISFTIPDGWQEIELTPQQRAFIEAKFEIPSADGVAELTLTSMGGGIDANIERWIGQFQAEPPESLEPEVEQLEISGVTARWVDVRGTYNSGFGGRLDAQSGMRLLGVGIPMQPRDFFLKLVGPRPTIAEIQDEFRQFARSARITQR